jgi:hypothetical protein
MSEPRISYSGSLETSPETEAPVLCSVYKFVLDCHAKKEAAPENRPDDGTKVKEDSANEHDSK